MVLKSVGLDTTPALSAPGVVVPTESASGGELAAGTYFYVVTAVNAFGETTGSAEVSATVTGSVGSVSLVWPAVTGAVGYKIYRGTSTGAQSI